MWKSYTIREEPRLLRVFADGTELRGPAGGAIWSAPTIDAKRGALYVGVGNTYSGAAQPTTDAILAFDLATGAMRWSQQMAPATPDVFGCTPGRRQLRRARRTRLRFRRVAGARDARRAGAS